MTCKTSAGRGLLLQSLARLGQQPGIFYCDHCLRGEVLQQYDLFVAEWPHLPSKCGNHAEQFVFFSKRHLQQRANAAGVDDPCIRRSVAVAFVSHGIGEMNQPLSVENSPQWGSLGWPEASLLLSGRDGTRRTVGVAILVVRRYNTELSPVTDQEAAIGDSAKRMRLFQDRVEYRGEVAGRQIDDL